MNQEVVLLQIKKARVIATRAFQMTDVITRELHPAKPFILRFSQ